MQELEEEIQKPTGIWTIRPPKLSVDVLLISRECGIMYEIIESEGLRYVTNYCMVEPPLVCLSLKITYLLSESDNLCVPCIPQLAFGARSRPTLKMRDPLV